MGKQIWICIQGHPYFDRKISYGEMFIEDNGFLMNNTKHPLDVNSNYCRSCFKKMAKCKYCEIEVDDREALIWVEGHYRIHIDENNCIESGEYPSDEIKINYCPMCGRKLED